MEILRIARQNESLTRSFSPPQCGQAFLPVHLASNTGGTWLTTFSIAKSRKPINNLSTGPSLLFFGRKIKAALVGIPALLGMPIFLSRRYAPVFEVEPPLGTFWPYFLRSTQKKGSHIKPDIFMYRGFKFKVQHPVLGYWRLLKKLHRVS